MLAHSSFFLGHGKLPIYLRAIVEVNRENTRVNNNMLDTFSLSPENHLTFDLTQYCYRTQLCNI